MVSATPSPSADGGRGLPGPLDRLVPRTFQARLTLAFVGVVTLTLLLVSVFVLNRLDDYFTQQRNDELRARATLGARWVDSAANEQVREAEEPVIVNGGLNPHAAIYLSKQVQGVADAIAQSDVQIRLFVDGGEGVGWVPVENGAFGARVSIEPPTGTREAVESVPYYLHSASSIDPYIIEVTLSNPYTFRQTTVANVTSLLAAVGIVALGIAIIVAAAVAHRFTTPLRRLT